MYNATQNDKRPTLYTCKPHPQGGWIIQEGQNAIAFTDTETYARAIVTALNDKRAALGSIHFDQFIVN